MPALKEYREDENPAQKIGVAAQQLIQIKEVAQGRMSHPTLTQQQAQKIYEKYGDAIDGLIALSKLQLTKLNYLESSVLEETLLKAAGKSLAVFASVGYVYAKAIEKVGPYVPLIGGEVKVATPQQIRDAYYAGDEMVEEKRKALDRYNNAVFVLNKSFEDISKNYVALVEAIVSGNESKINSYTEKLANSMKESAKALQDVKIAAEGVGLTSQAIGGALGVYKDFLLEIGVTVAMMGVTKVGMSAVGKGLKYIADTPQVQKILSAISEGGVGTARSIAQGSSGFSKAVFRFVSKTAEFVSETAKKEGVEPIAKLAKGGYKGVNTAENFYDELNTQNKSNNADQLELASSLF
ncbi:MAG: hypothetical protein QW153_00905 [Candidatus Bilamarchaeaceae archaeon]